LKKVKMFALSTCGWCRKTKRFLNENDVEYEFVDVDLLSGEERQQVMQEMQRWNPRRNFPTIVVDDAEVVVGFNESRLREVLDL
jgi:glutaredoxin-like protein NrdH